MITSNNADRMRKLSCGLSLLIAANLLPGTVLAQEYSVSAFQECSSKAYLTQGSRPSTYGLNLVTGDYNVKAGEHPVRGDAKGEALKSGLNAIGFSPADRFAYGWSYMHNEPARIHGDWSVEPLTGVNITKANFYVGDVSSTGDKYFVYNNSTDTGLYSIGLDPAVEDYMKMRKIIDAGKLSLRIADFAFNPVDNQLYALAFDGNFHQIDPATGDSTLLGDAGVTGVFGAAYFDPDGTFYASRNNDGKIFKIRVSSGDYTADLFASGPSSRSNDGFRCAIAPIIDVTDKAIDFGDAPNSYGTLLADNGARHGLTAKPSLMLGSHADGESDAYVFPLSDEDNKPGDEDGVKFITSLAENESAIAMVSAKDVGYLNAWIDFNQNGTFDSGEQIVTDRLLQAKAQRVDFNVPDSVVGGETWARFRISTAMGLQPTGGAPDGEVEDYQVTLEKSSVAVSTYPSKSGWSTVAFEDNWPFVADYDMNDLIAQLRTHRYKNSSGYVKVVIEGNMAAAGADYANGFGIRLEGVPRDAIDEDKIEFTIQNRKIKTSPLEAGRKEAILIVTENMFDVISAGRGCKFYRTEAGCGSDPEFNFKISVPFKVPQNVELSGVFDPFLFATPDAFHGAHFVTPPGRSYEIHLKNKKPTEAFDSTLFANVGQDLSNPDNGYYFLTGNSLPWAIEIGTQWRYPLEFVEIVSAYPGFSKYASSNGQENKDWYLESNANQPLLFSE